MSTPIGDKTDRDLHPAGNGTGPQPATGAHAASQPRAAQPKARTTIGVVHNDLQAVGRAISHAVPVLEAIACDPVIDELVAEILEAAHAGVAEPYFQSAIDALRAARQRQLTIAPPGQGSGPQPAFLPAPADGSEAM